MKQIPIVLLTNYIDLSVKLPAYATAGSSGIDLIAAITNNMTIKPFRRLLIPNGFKLELPKGYEAQIRPRSGLAYKYGITVLNSPGTIDSDYRGEIQTLLINLGQDDFIITPGMRISQMVINSVMQADLHQSNSISNSVRGVGGFGSTGIE